MRAHETKEQKGLDPRETRAAHLSIMGAATVFLISFVVGLAVDSVALLLDAGAGLVILLMAVFVRTNLEKISNPPDPRYNFGYAKYESLTVLLQNGAILLTCLLGIAFALQDMFHPEDISRYDLPAGAAFVSALCSLMLAFYLGRVAKKTGSAMLRTAALHWRVDASLSFGMCAGFFAGLLLVRAGFVSVSPYVDPVMAILLALVVMRQPLRDLALNAQELLDGVPEPAVHEKIKQAVQKHGTVFQGIHRMRVRKAGRRMFLDVGFKVPAALTLEKAQFLAENFEEQLTREIPGCDVVVYFK